MFGNFFNSLTGQGQQPQGVVPPEGTEGVPPQQGGGNDSFLTGLMNVAQGVGKSLAEKSQEGTEAMKSGANTVAVTTTTTAEGAGRMTKEQMDNLASGISDLVGKAAGAFSQNKNEVEEQITSVDSQGGKVQVSSVSDGVDTTTKVTQRPQEGSDFLSGLMDVAKQVGQAIGDKTQGGAAAVKSGASSVADTTKSTAEGAGKLTKEQMDQIASGISSLVGKAAGAFSSNKSDEQMTSVDSQGGKVQISSVSDGTTTATTVTADKSAEGSDFLSGLMDVAKQVSQSIGEKSHDKDVESRALPADTSKGTAQGAKEDLDKISAGIGDFIGKAAEALHIGDKKEPSPEKTTESTKSTEGGSDLLSGLMGLAKDITKKVGDPKEPEVTFDNSKPEIDDIEGEIGKITTMGYTSEGKQLETEKEPGLIASVVDKSKEMASGAAGAVGSVAEKAVDTVKGGANYAVNTVKGGAHYIADTAKSGAEAVVDKTKEIGGAVKDTAVSTGESAIDMTKRGVSTVVNTAAEGAGYVAGATAGLVERGASAVVDTGSTAIDKTKELGGSTIDAVKGGANSATESIKSGTGAVVDKGKEIGEAVKEGASSAVKKTKELGGSAVDSVKSGANAVHEGASSAAEKTKELGSSAIDKTIELGGSAVDSVKGGANTAYESLQDAGVGAAKKTKDGANYVSEKAEEGLDYAMEGTKHLGSKLKEGGEAAIDKTRQLGGAVKDSASSAYSSISEGAKETGGAVKGIATEGAKEGAESMKEGWESGKESVRKSSGPLEEKSIIPERAERSPERKEGIFSDIGRDLREGYSDLKEAAADVGGNLKYQLTHGGNLVVGTLASGTEILAEDLAKMVKDLPEERAEREALKMEEEGGGGANIPIDESKILASETGEYKEPLREDEGTDVPPERQPEGTNESMEGKEQDEEGSIIYESAVDVGNAILGGAASLAEAVRDTTGAVLGSVLQGVDDVSEETMYGPDRERRSQSPSPQDRRLEVLDSDNKEVGTVIYGLLHPALQPGVQKDPTLDPNLVAFTSPPRGERRIPVETNPIEIHKVAVVNEETMSDVFGRKPESQLKERRFDLAKEEFPPLEKEEFRERVDSHLSSSSWTDNESRDSRSKIPIRSQPGAGSKNNLLKSSDTDEDDEGVGSYKESNVFVNAERRPAEAGVDVNYPPRTFNDPQ